LKRFSFALTLSLFLAILVSACGLISSPAVQTIELTDGLGRVVSLAAPAQRIV